MKQLLNLKCYLTFLSRNKVYTAINVFGLSISLMFVLIIGVYTQEEYSTDKMHSKADRIYLQGYSMKYNGGEQVTTGSSWYMQKHLKARYPDIESSCAMSYSDLKATQKTGDKLPVKVLFADSTFYRIFDFELVQGDPNHVLDASNSAVITEETAKKLYGNADPMGKPVILGDSIRLVVTGVARKMEGSSIVPADVVARFEYVRFYNPSLTDERMGNANGVELALLMKPGHDIRTRSRDIDKYMKDINWVYRMPDVETHVLFVPLNELYFSKVEGSTRTTMRGNISLVNVLFAVELIILFFSIFNYINLTVAQSGKRAGEMATRRLFGCRRKDIILKLMMESIMMCMASLLLAGVMAFVAVKYANQLLATEIDLMRVFAPTNLLLVFAFVIVDGVTAGVLPAIYISRSKPIDVVRGTFKTHVKMRFSKVFIVLQNMATILLMACAMTIGLQTHHLISAPLGYDTGNLLNIDNPSNDSVAVRQFKERIAKLSCVKGISACQSSPLERGNNLTTKIYGRTVSFQSFVGDRDFFDVLGLKLTKDYRRSTEKGIYVNARAFADSGLPSDARFIDLSEDSRHIPIKGVVNDFMLGTVTTEQHPVIIDIKDKLSFYPWNFLIKITGNPVEAYREVQRVYREVFKEELDDERPFVDQQLQHIFDKEIRFSKIALLFAFIAIVISMLGLIAMSMYFIQQRHKEIAVRKVFGSNNGQILKKLLRSFAGYVLVAFVLAVPLVWYFMSDWLSQYSYRIALSPWIFVVTGIVSLSLSVLAVYFRCRKASNENPILHIKDNQ